MSSRKYIKTLMEHSCISCGKALGRYNLNVLTGSESHLYSHFYCSQPCVSKRRVCVIPLASPVKIPPGKNGIATDAIVGKTHASIKYP